MKKKIMMLLVMVCTLLFAGCAKIIETRTEKVEVLIIDEYHKSAWVQPIKVGKATTTIAHSSQNKITVEYNGTEYTVDDKEVYCNYKEKVGETATGIFEVRYYDNGHTDIVLIGLE